MGIWLQQAKVEPRSSSALSKPACELPGDLTATCGPSSAQVGFPVAESWERTSASSAPSYYPCPQACSTSRRAYRVESIPCARSMFPSCGLAYGNDLCRHQAEAELPSAFSEWSKKTLYAHRSGLTVDAGCGLILVGNSYCENVWPILRARSPCGNIVIGM